jgi:hypothetical protein
VKSLEKLRTLNTAFVILVLISAFISNATVHASVESMQTFYEEEGYPGLSIKVKATGEMNPGWDMNITIRIESTAGNLSIEYLYLNVYGFRGGQEKILLTNITHMTKKTLDYGDLSQGNYTVNIPNDVWYRTYAELHFKYAIKETLYGPYTDGFTMTAVKNVKMEELDNALRSLNESYRQLNETYHKLQQNYTSLNQTYWDLKGGSDIAELETTRSILVVLAITTVFFVATTIYLVMRKPKQYW